MQSNVYYVYILASKRNGTLYIGVTSDLEKRIREHKVKLHKGFTSKYNVTVLVYYETTNLIESAIIREKQLKSWNRRWKLKLIEMANPSWIDLDPRMHEDDIHTAYLDQIIKNITQ